MLAAFIGAVAFTLGVSFLCSMMEAFILSTTVAEVEAFKKKRPKNGNRLEKLINELPKTISAVLTLNTIANTAGSAVVGWLAGKLWGNAYLAVVAGLLTFGILVISEIIPKNLGVTYRVQLQSFFAPLLTSLSWLLSPVTYLTSLSVKLVIKESEPSDDGASEEEEIILLAEKGAKEGSLTSDESDMVANALKLDDVMVSEIMTPRIVVTALEKSLTVENVSEEYPNIPFARLPVYDEEIDNIVGVVRRRDLLKEKADDHDNIVISDLMDEANFVPETVNVASALETILKTHQQLLMVVDEFGSLAGVVSMEDIIEYIIGREIFEKDDVAVDMRELARAEGRKNAYELEKEQAKHTEKRE